MVVGLVVVGFVFLPRERQDEPEPSGDTRPFTQLAVLESPDGHRKAVLETFDASPAGAGPAVLRLDRGCDGCCELHGTDATAFFSPDGRFLIFHDVCCVVALDFGTGTVRHLTPPHGSSFTRVHLDGHWLNVSGCEPSGRSFALERVTLEPPDPRWAPGPGPAVLPKISGASRLGQPDRARPPRSS
ncbi:MAG: hypothetical protein HY814_05145 [Candidatus Riflebacteria bacterium]|nr:hypothetical protein [Candidatus Riflebacteria bacterium]